MGNSSVEAIQLIRRKILANTTITQKISGRIYLSHFLDPDNSTLEMPLVIIEDMGGLGNYGMGVQKLKIHVYTYSKNSSAEAASIYSLVYQNLHAQRLVDNVSGTSVTAKGMVYESERPYGGFNESVKAWFKRASYVIHTSG